MFDVDLIGAPAFSVSVVGAGFVFTGFNAALAEIAGLDRAEVVGRSPEMCLPPELAEAVVARYRRCVAARHAIESEALYALPAGDRWFHVTLTPVLDPDGAVSSLVGVSTDVTARKIAAREHREAEARMALAMDAIDGGFWHLDIATGAFALTPKLGALVAGRAAGEMSWAEYTAAIHPDDRPGIAIDDLARGACEGATAEYRVPDADGGVRWFRSRRRLIRAASGEPERIVGLVTDITEQRRLQDSYEAQARTDPLTGLANRRGFERRAADFLRRAADGRRFGLLVLDLDRFKPINDQHGHATGDAVLRAVADRLRSLVEPGDVVARLGGDEFGVLVQDIEGGALSRLAGRMAAAARAPVATASGAVAVGASLGGATSAPHAGLADLTGRADEALYEAKRAGRGTWKIAA